MFVRTTGDPVAALPAVRAAVRHIEPDAVFHGARTLSDIAEESAAATRLASRLLAGFAGIALVLAAIGVYGVMSYRCAVARASSARASRSARARGDITRLVLRQAGVLAIVGLTAGTAATLVLARTLSSLLFGVPPWDPVTLASAGALLALATLAASYLPARRAARVDPASILASE